MPHLPSLHLPTIFFPLRVLIFPSLFPLYLFSCSRPAVFPLLHSSLFSFYPFISIPRRVSFLFLLIQYHSLFLPFLFTQYSSTSISPLLLPLLLPQYSSLSPSLPFVRVSYLPASLYLSSSPSFNFPLPTVFSYLPSSPLFTFRHVPASPLSPSLPFAPHAAQV